MNRRFFKTALAFAGAVLLSTVSFAGESGVTTPGSTTYPNDGLSYLGSYNPIAEENFHSTDICVDGRFALLATRSSPPTIMRINLDTGMKESSTVLDLETHFSIGVIDISPTGESFLFLTGDAIYEGDVETLQFERKLSLEAYANAKGLVTAPDWSYVYVYAAGETLLKIDLATFEITDSTTLTNTHYRMRLPISSDGQYLYHVSSGASTVVTRIETDGLTEEYSRTLPSSDNCDFAMMTSNDELLVAGSEAGNYIYKLETPSLSTLDWESIYYYDMQNGFLAEESDAFWARPGVNRVLVKHSLSTLAYEGIVEGPPDLNAFVEPVYDPVTKRAFLPQKYNYGGVQSLDLSKIPVPPYIELEAEDGAPGASIVDEANDKLFLFDGAPTTVVKIDLATRAREAGVELSAGNFGGAVMHPTSGTMYIVVNEIPARVICLGTDMTTSKSLTLASDEVKPKDIIISPDGTTLYVATYDSGPTIQGKIVKINTEPFERVSTYSAPILDERRISTMVMNPDGSAFYVFSGIYTNLKVYRMMTNTFTRNGEISVTDFHGAYDSTIDPSGQFAVFFGSSYTHYLRLSNFTLGQRFTGSAARVISDDGLFFYGTDYLTPSQVSIMQSNGDIICTFPVAGSLEPQGLTLDRARDELILTTNNNPAHVYFMDAGSYPTFDNMSEYYRSYEGEEVLIDEPRGHFYVSGQGSTAYDSSDPTILKFDLETGEFLDGLLIDIDWGGCAPPGLQQGAIDSTGTYGYFPAGCQPGFLLKVHLPTMTLVDSVNMGTARTYPKLAVLDASGDSVYVTSAFISEAYVTRYATSDLSKTGEITLPVEVGETRYGFYHPGTNAIYIYSTQTDPAKIAKIDMDTFSHVGTCTFNAGERIYSHTLVPGENTAYFGCTSAQVVEVSLDPFARIQGTQISGQTSVVTGLSYDPFSDSLIVTVPGSPTSVFKLDAKTLAELGTVTLPTYNRYTDAGSTDPETGWGLFGNSWSSPLVSKVSILASSPKGVLFGTKVNISEPAQLDTMKFYSHASTGTLHLSLYDAEFPYTKLWNSNAVTISGTGEAQEAISAGTPSAVPLPAGEYYLAWQTDRAVAVGSYTAGATGDGFYSRNRGFSPPEKLGAKLYTSDAQWTQSLTWDMVETVGATHVFDTGTTVTQTFPLQGGLEVEIMLRDVTTSGTVQVTLSFDKDGALAAGIDPARLINHRWNIENNNVIFDSARIVFHYDEAELDGLDEATALEAVWAVFAGSVERYDSEITIDTEANTVTVDPVYHFSDWYIGNQTASTESWMILGD